jgi:hypothetical protein
MIIVKFYNILNDYRSPKRYKLIFFAPHGVGVNEENQFKFYTLCPLRLQSNSFEISHASST